MGLTYEKALELAKSGGETVIPTICGMCGPSAGCGIYAFVKDGIFKYVVGMDECPVNKGAVCAKGNAAPQWVYAQERLKTPLLRIGEKGEGRFKEISWDEAMDILTEKLKSQKEEFGPESLAILSPARRSYSEYIQRFLIAHGSPNYGHSGICFMQRAFGFLYTLGTLPWCDYENADLIIYWGRQPVFSGPATSVARDFMVAKKRGAKTVGIKPSMEADSDKMDEWVPVRPGTDAALALSMLNVVISEDLIDHDFVEKWCYGYDQLKEHIEKYPPDWGEKITGVPKEQIIRIASEYACTKRACIDLGNGIEHSSCASDTIRAVAILMAVTGHLDRKGCNIFFPGAKTDIPRQKNIALHHRYTKEMVDKLVAPEFPKEFQPFMEGTSSSYYGILESVLTEDPYPVRCIISPGTQPSVSTRGTKNVIEALKKLDFYVVVDVTETADMKYADLVFPTLTVYESDHPFEILGNRVMARNRVIEPLGEYRSIFEFFIELGERMGYGDDFWLGSTKKWQEDLLEPFGMTIEELRAYPCGKEYPVMRGGKTYENYEAVFSRNSMRIEGGPLLEQGKVALYNTLFEKYGYSPMPVWKEQKESLTSEEGADVRKKYPLIFSDYHTCKAYSASWQRNVPSLRKIMREPVVHINPETAAKRNISDGDMVKIESSFGWIKAKAELYSGIRPDTVMMVHGWWQGCDALGFKDMPIADGGSNVNNLYSVEADMYDPLVTAMSSQALVEVSRIDE